MGANLASARSTELAQKEAHEKLIATKLKEHGDMLALYTEKQATLGENDGDLAGKKQELKEAQDTKATKENFLAELAPLCKQREKEYDQRKALRANEDAAISEAIS